jgi:hypothetical protein
MGGMTPGITISMDADFVGFLSNFLGLSLLSSTVLAGGGSYLAKIGPGPLRFQPAAMRFNPAMVLPPLDMGNGTGGNDHSSSNNSFTNAVAEIEALSGVSDQIPPSLFPVETEAVSPPLIISSGVTPAPAPSELTPQVLLRYFTTNSAAETIVAPNVPFTPPVPNRGSSAIYISR